MFAAFLLQRNTNQTASKGMLSVLCYRMQTMLQRQYIVTVGWEQCLVFYEDAKSDKRPVKPCRIVPDPKAGQQATALHQGHTSDILTAAMQVASHTSHLMLLSAIGSHMYVKAVSSAINTFFYACEPC